MEPSISSSFLREWDPHAMVACFAEHGWRAVELHDTHGRQLIESGDPFTVGQRFRAYAGDQGVAFLQGHLAAGKVGRNGESVWFDIAPADEIAFAQAMDEMRRWVDLFAGLGVSAGVLHVGGALLQLSGWEAQRALARRAEALTTVAERAQGGPTTICVENLTFPDSGVESIQEILSLLAAVGRDDLGICLDTGHAHMGGADIPAFIHVAGKRLMALHLNDNDGQRDGHLLPYGGGTIAWGPVLCALRENGYRGPLNLEITGEAACPRQVRLMKLDYALELARWMIGQLEA